MAHRGERRTLKDPPLVLVLAEVRFPPVLKMESRIPDLQDELRGRGFPRFTQAIGQEFTFAPGEGARLTTSSRWLFGSRADDEHVVLTNTSMALQTAAYTNFETFSETFASAIDVLAQLVSPSFSERVGLRYFNVVEADEGRSINDYINSEMRALSAESLEAEDVLWNVETVANVAPGQLRVRLSQQTDAPAVPFDLLTPEVRNRFPNISDKTTGLDIDCSTEKSAEFNSASLLDVLWSLHYYTDRAFIESVTKEALSAWGEKVEATD